MVIMNLNNIINHNQLNNIIWDVYDWNTRKKCTGIFKYKNNNIIPIRTNGNLQISLEDTDVLQSFLETQTNWIYERDIGINGLEGAYVKSGTYKKNGYNLHISIIKDKKF